MPLASEYVFVHVYVCACLLHESFHFPEFVQVPTDIFNRSFSLKIILRLKFFSVPKITIKYLTKKYFSYFLPILCLLLEDKENFLNTTLIENEWKMEVLNKARRDFKIFPIRNKPLGLETFTMSS